MQRKGQLAGCRNYVSATHCQAARHRAGQRLPRAREAATTGVAAQCSNLACATLRPVAAMLDHPLLPRVLLSVGLHGVRFDRMGFVEALRPNTSRKPGECRGSQKFRGR